MYPSVNEQPVRINTRAQHCSTRLLNSGHYNQSRPQTLKSQFVIAKQPTMHFYVTLESDSITMHHW